MNQRLGGQPSSAMSDEEVAELAQRAAKVADVAARAGATIARIKQSAESGEQLLLTSADCRALVWFLRALTSREKKPA